MRDVELPGNNSWRTRARARHQADGGELGLVLMLALLRVGCTVASHGGNRGARFFWARGARGRTPYIYDAASSGTLVFLRAATEILAFSDAFSRAVSGPMSSAAR